MKAVGFARILRMTNNVIGAMLLFCVVAQAGVINIGLISFDVLIPHGTGLPGVNIFEISNLTGDPASGGFALLPDFPAFTPLTLTGSKITLTPSAGPPQTIVLGDIAPGTFVSTGPLQFPDTSLFSSGVFSATLSTTHILLAGGSTFVAASPSFSTVLLPSSGPSLIADRDSAVITVADVPECATSTLVLAGLVALAVAHRKRWHARSFRFPRAFQ